MKCIKFDDDFKNIIEETRTSLLEEYGECFECDMPPIKSINDVLWDDDTHFFFYKMDDFMYPESYGIIDKVEDVYRVVDILNNTIIHTSDTIHNAIAKLLSEHYTCGETQNDYMFQHVMSGFYMYAKPKNMKDFNIRDWYSV